MHQWSVNASFVFRSLVFPPRFASPPPPFPSPADTDALLILNRRRIRSDRHPRCISVNGHWLSRELAPPFLGGTLLPLYVRLYACGGRGE